MRTILEALQHADDAITGGGLLRLPAVAEEWADAGFETGEECEPWCRAGCFNPDSAAELRGAGISPSDVSPTHRAFGSAASIGYWHSSCDLTTDDVLALLAE